MCLVSMSCRSIVSRCVRHSVDRSSWLRPSPPWRSRHQGAKRPALTEGNEVVAVTRRRHEVLVGMDRLSTCEGLGKRRAPETKTSLWCVSALYGPGVEALFLPVTATSRNRVCRAPGPQYERTARPSTIPTIAVQNARSDRGSSSAWRLPSLSVGDVTDGTGDAARVRGTDVGRSRQGCLG